MNYDDIIRRKINAALRAGDLDRIEKLESEGRKARRHSEGVRNIRGFMRGMSPGRAAQHDEAIRNFLRDNRLDDLANAPDDEAYAAALALGDDPGIDDSDEDLHIGEELML